MNGFIEVTEKIGGCAVLLSVSKITAVVDMGDCTFIETGVSDKGESTGISVIERFSEVKAQITN